MAFKRKFKKTRKTYRGKSSRKSRARKFTARVKKALLKTAETKYVMGAGENRSCYHDRGDVSAGLLTTSQGALIWDPWFAITKGTSISNRIGDEIYPRGMSIRMFYNCSADRPSQYVRIIVAVIPKVVSGLIMSGSNFDLMDAQGSNDTVTGMIKREGVKVLYDKVRTFESDGARAVPAAGDSRFFKKIYIKSKRGGKLSWQQDGTLSNKPVGVWVVPYDGYNTLRSDILGYVSWTYKLYFKDV